MQMTKSAAEKLLSDLGLSDIPLSEYHPRTPHLAPDWFATYKKLCKQFIASLTDAVETLAFMNLSQDEFMNLIMGQSIPENLSIRFRVPLMLGGDLSTDNMFMCWTFPHSYNLDRFLISQADCDTIWLPTPSGKVFLPAHTAGGGDGGNATEDRLAQISAQLAGGRE